MTGAKKPHVLVVDDEPSVLMTYQMILEQQGYQVLVAENGREALERAKSSLPDLILLDLMMPGMDGMTLLTKLRREPGFEDLPVIMLSALSDEAGMRKAKELGAQDYLVKSRFTYDDLVRRVEQHVRH